MLFKNSFANTAKNIFGNVRNFGSQLPSFLTKGLSTLNEGRNTVKRLQDLKSKIDDVGRKLQSEVPDNVSKTVRGLSGKVDEGLNRAGQELERGERIGNVLSGLF